jgi:glycosyltransferase involved in cell wall biosynthesis
MRVVMLISNGYEPDVRVQKEAHTLAVAGYRVTVIAWDRTRRYVPHELEPIPDVLQATLAEWEERTTSDPPPISIIRIQYEAGYRTGRRLLRAIPIFWWRAWHELRRAQPDIVHANDLDTLPLAYLYHRLTGVPVIYDAREYYPGMVRDNVGTLLSRVLDKLDGWLARQVDVVITVGNRLKARYEAMGVRVWVVYNSQPQFDQETIEAAGAALRQSLGIPADGVLVVYVGYLTPDRLLTPLLDAVRDMDSIWVAIAGDGPQRQQVQAAADSCSRIRYLGWVPLDQVAGTVAAADIVYYGLNDDNDNSFYFMPNLAFFALAVGRPLLTTPVGEIAEMVQQEGWGVVIDSVNSDSVREVLGQLAPKPYRATLAQRARSLGQTHYSWYASAAQLTAAYRFVASQKNLRDSPLFI